MLVLFDHGTPRGIAEALQGHTVKESRALGWDTLSNGDLLSAAETAGFQVLVTTDKNLGHQQNLSNRRIAIVVLGKGRWTLIKPELATIAAAVSAATPGTFTTVDIPDTK
ncbi:MAG: hypothetical protein ACREQD_02705 [Candidatus Binataceae bacterium]